MRERRLKRVLVDPGLVEKALSVGVRAASVLEGVPTTACLVDVRKIFDPVVGSPGFKIELWFQDDSFDVIPITEKPPELEVTLQSERDPS